MAFLYPYFLLLSLAVVVPIAIHLFNFHRFRKVHFTNVAMLKNLTIVNRKQNKIYERLILLVRCLIIVLLSLLFAQPYIKNENNKLKNDNGNAVVIVLDNSFSMQNISDKGSVLQQAKSKTEEILKEYSDNDVFCLLTMDMQGKHKHFMSKKYFMEFLKEVEISSACEPYSVLINTAHHLLQLRNEKSKRVFLISDFQTSQTDLNNIKQDTAIQDIFVPIQVSNVNNIYVDSITFDRNIYQKGQKVNMKVSLTNASDEKAENIPIKLYIDDLQQSMANISLAEHSSVMVDMSFVIKESGMLRGKINVMDAPVTYDDDFYFALNIDEKIKVLAINHNKENAYINRLFANSQEVELHNMNENSIDFSQFGLYNTIILSEVENISSGLCQEINNFRQNGGSLIIIPPAKMNISSFNEALKQLHLPQYETLVEKNISTNVLDDKNPLYKSVFTSITENMPLPKIKKYYKFSNTQNVARQDIITLENKDAFLLENTENQSKCFLFAVAFSEEFSDFCSQSIFVPTLWNMVLYSEKLIKPFLFMNDNSFVDISLFAKDIESEVITLNSDNSAVSIIPQMLRKNNNIGFAINNQIKQADIYYIKDKEKTLGIMAFNYPRQESKLIFNTPTQLSKTTRQAGLKNIKVFDNKKMIRTYFTQSNKQFDFTLLIILTLAICLVGEVLLLRKIKNN